MNALHNGTRAPHAAVVNIEAELAYWRQCYQQQSFHRAGQGFEAYVPTLKFGYDAYLLHPHDPLELLLPALKMRYEDTLPPAQRLDWAQGKRIIEETWLRLQA